MKARNKVTPIPILLILFFMVTATVFVLPLYAKQASKGITSATTWGWCCQNGKITWSTSTQCAKHKGHFFKNKKDAQAYLDAQTPGWCCLDGKVLSLKKDDCLKKKGKFFKDKKAAATWCDAQTPGYCCMNGKTLVMKKGDCLKKKGHFFKDKKTATTWCDAQIPGWCCLDGKVLSLKKGDCLKKKGHFFKDQKAARDACDPLGWCLLEGKMTHIRKSACEKKKGKFFIKKTEADKAARMAFAGTSAHEANGHKKAAPGIAPLSLTHKAKPYLTVEKLYLKKVGNDYLVRVEIKNRGKGKLTKEDYNKGALALRREGSKWHWPLFKVDKKGNLNRGKTVAYTTGAIISVPTTIQISFMHVPGGTKSARLMPPIGKPIGKFVRGAKKVPAGAATPSAKPMRAGKKPLAPKTTMMAGKVKPNIKNQRVPKVVPNRLDTTKVTIIEPGLNWQYCIGEKMHIRYNVSSNRISGLARMVLVNTETEEQTEFHRIRLGSRLDRKRNKYDSQFDSKIPEDFQPGTYVIKAMWDDFVYGESEPFQILPDSSPLDFQGIPRNSEYAAGDLIRFEYQLAHRVASVPITFRLLHNGAVLAEETSMLSMPPSSHLHTQSMTFRIPDGVPPGNYHLFADTPHHNVTGISRRFTINANERISNLDNGMTIEILEPTDLTYVRNNTRMRLNLSNGGGRGHSIGQVHLQLIKASPGEDYGTVVYEYPEIYGESEPFTSKIISVSLFPGLPLGRYRFFAQANLARGDRFARCSAYSPVFMIYPAPRAPESVELPSVEIRTPRGGQTVYTGRQQQLWVQWNLLHVHGEHYPFYIILLKNGVELQRNYMGAITNGPRETGDTDETHRPNFDLVALSVAGYLSGSDYQVRVEMYREDTDGRRELIASATTPPFTLINNAYDAYDFEHNPVHLLEPSGWGDRDVYIYGGTIRIRWEYHAPTREEAMRNRLRISLTRDSSEGGGQWVIASDIPPYPNHYDWIIPDDLPTGPGYRILIERTTGPGQSNSGQTFTIEETRRFRHE